MHAPAGLMGPRLTGGVFSWGPAQRGGMPDFLLQSAMGLPPFKRIGGCKVFGPSATPSWWCTASPVFSSVHLSLPGSLVPPVLFLQSFPTGLFFSQWPNVIRPGFLEAYAQLQLDA